MKRNEKIDAFFIGAILFGIGSLAILMAVGFILVAFGVPIPIPIPLPFLEAPTTKDLLIFGGVFLLICIAGGITFLKLWSKWEAKDKEKQNKEN